MEKIKSQLWEQLNEKYNYDNEFRNEILELIRFYASKLVRLSENEEQRQFISENTEGILLGQYFHGYELMKILIDNNELNENEEQVFYPEFWSIPKGIMLNQIGKIMVYQFDRDWAYHEGLQKYNQQFIRLFPEGYDLYREILLEAANYGAYNAIIQCESYKSSENQKEKGVLLGSRYDYEFVNPQVFLKAGDFSPNQETWEVYKNSNGITEDIWMGTIQLSTIPNEKRNFYILSLSLSDSIQNDEKYRILEKVYNRIPENIKANMQIRMYYLSDLKIISVQNNTDANIS